MADNDKAITNPQELGKAIKNEPNEITVEGDLAKHVYKIKATGKVAWVIAFGAVAVAVIAVLTLPAGALAGPAGLIADGVIAGVATTTAAAAIGVLGFSATAAAIGIGVGARNASVLKTIRNDYIVLSKTNNRLVLKRK
ncbi:MAG: hypothetical protein IJK32_00985 [Bacteroidales bacterium]|nr:hypothetical protein [Bacteroidales bacterium]